MPTSPDNLVLLNGPTDNPSAAGINAITNSIQAALDDHVDIPSGIAAGDVPVWNGSAFVVPSGTRDGTKFLRDDGAWAEPSGAMELIFDHVPNATSDTVDSNTILGGDLPATFTHLKAIIRYAHNNSGAGNAYVRFNANSAAAYSTTYQNIQTTSVTGNEVLLDTKGYIGGEFAAPAGWGSDSPATVELLIPFYRDTSVYRSWQFSSMRYNTSGGAGAIIVRQGAGVWRASDAAGRLQFFTNTGLWSNQARVTLYGIT